MTIVTSFKELNNFVNSFLLKEGNTIFNFYVLFYLLDEKVYKIEYNEESKEYIVSSMDKLTYTNLLSEEEIYDEEEIENKEKGSVLCDNVSMYLAFQKIKEETAFSSIVEIDEMRTLYSPTIEESIIEEDDNGNPLIFSNLIYGASGLEGEENGTYIISKYTNQEEKIESTEYKKLPSIETIEFQNKDGVDNLTNILVEKGYGSTYSILMSIAKRDIFIQASKEVFSTPLVINKGAEIEIPNEVNGISFDNIRERNLSVLGKKNTVTKPIVQVIDVVSSVSNINDAIIKQQKELERRAEENDKNIRSIPYSGIRAVYSYEGIQNLITSVNRVFRMICLGTAYCYEITKQTNGQYKVSPKGRDDTTLNEWFNKYGNIILLFNGNIANSFARVVNEIVINELNDIDENIYSSYSQLKAYTIQFTIKGQISPVTLLGSHIQDLFKMVVEDIKEEREYMSMVESENGLIGWDGSSLYYRHINETGRNYLDLDKVMRGIERLLDQQGLLGSLKRYTTKVEEANEKAKEEEIKEEQKKANKKSNSKKNGTIKYTIGKNSK